MIKNDNLNGVVILLSTYNGEHFLRDQLTSLLNQNYSNIKILIRDDGSTDKTREILNEFEQKNSLVDVIYGENIGVIKSFFRLLKEAKEYQYYAFCDQDDIWLEDKVSRAISSISKYDSDVPVLYGSNLTIVDENLKIIKKAIKKKYTPSLNNALFQNIIAGCTTVINNEARKYLIIDIPEKLRMHDWWMYQVVSCIGEVIYDSESRILYRQHDSNTVGADTGLIGFWKNRIFRLNTNKTLPYIMHHASELKRIFEADMSTENLQIINDLLNINSISKRIKYAVLSSRLRQNTLDNIIFKILIIFKKI